MAVTSEQPKRRVESLWVRIVSGSVGSIITALVVTPLEVVKIRQQFQSPASQRAAVPTIATKDVGKCPSCGVFVFNNGLKECFLPRNVVPYFDPVTGILKENASVTQSRGTIAMLRSIFRTEGMAGIYAGLTPTLVMGVPNTVLYFASYEDIRERIKRSELISSSVGPAVAGAAARLLTSVATAPFELMKTRMAAQVGGGGSADGLFAEMSQVVHREGALALYKGLGPTLMRDIPFSAVYWYCIETFRISWGDNSHATQMEQTGQALVIGSAAGMISAAATTPLDVVKTRRQVMPSVEIEAIVADSSTAAVCDHHGAIAYEAKVTGAPKSTINNSTIATMRQIAIEEGVSGLWRGNQARMIKVAPACAIMLASYEAGKRLLSDSAI